MVANRIQSMLAFPITIQDIKSVAKISFFDDYKLILFFASTWGDGELQIDMENFFTSFFLDLQGKKYAMCELGNYYGYDDFEFGALRVMRHFLIKTGGEEIIQPLCMDSLPHKDWIGLHRWCSLLNDACRELS